jgi:signal transduction histidine kinase
MVDEILPARWEAADRLPARWWLTRWWRKRGLQARVTMTAAAGLLVAFAAADLLLFNALRVSLTRSVDDSARQGATEVAELIDANRLTYPVIEATGAATIQVLDASGRIIDESPDADQLVPLLSPAQAAASARTGAAYFLAGAPYDMPSLLRVTAVAANGGYLVIAAVPYGSAAGSLSVVAKALAFGTPLLFILFTATTWLVVGSTLRPVAELRRGASRITATGVPHDLPVPESRDEVRSLALTLNDMLQRLAEAGQRQRDLVSDTAHELRSPIASIRAQLEVALDHPDRQDWAETARDVLTDTLRLSRLAEDLLALARLDESGGRVRRATTLDLAALSATVAERYAGARVPVVAPAVVPGKNAPMAGDRDSLDRLLVNLIDNAVRYARSRVTVTVRVPAGDQCVVLAVTDDGPGIPAADAERAFGRFTRLDAARSRDGEDPGGAGLGLAIVRATAQAHGGTAWLEPAFPGSSPPGLRAVVRLPAADAAPRGLPAAPGEQGGDRDRDEQQGQIRDRQVEQAHRHRVPGGSSGRGPVRPDPGVQPVRLGEEPPAEPRRARSVDPPGVRHQRQRGRHHRVGVPDDPPRHIGGRGDHRQHRDASGGVVLAEFHCQRPEVRRGPQEDDREQHDRRDRYRALDRGPADEDGKTARRAADHDVRWTAPLEQQRVDEDVEQDRRVGQRGGQPVGHQAEQQCRPRAERDPPGERLARLDRSGRVDQRTARGALHHRVDVAVDVAVDGVRAARRERAAGQRNED